MKATKSITDSKGITWTIENVPGKHFQDFHVGRSSVGHRTCFHTRSGALKWLKRMATWNDAFTTVRKNRDSPGQPSNPLLYYAHENRIRQLRRG